MRETHTKTRMFAHAHPRRRVLLERTCGRNPVDPCKSVNSSAVQTDSFTCAVISTGLLLFSRGAAPAAESPATPNLREDRMGGGVDLGCSLRPLLHPPPPLEA